MSEIIKKGLRSHICHATFNRDEMQKALNLHYIGTEHCNEVKDGIVVPIEHGNRYELEKAAWNACPNYSLDVEADLTSDGKLINFRVV